MFAWSIIMDKKVRRNSMPKIIELNTYRTKFTKRMFSKPKNRKFRDSEKMEPLYVGIPFNNQQLMMFKRILESEIDAHEGRKDYTMIIAYGLKTIDFKLAAARKIIYFHPYEIYYYIWIIRFYIDSYHEELTELEEILVNELHDIFVHYGRNEEVKKIIDDFAYKDPQEKIKIVVQMCQ